MEMPLAARRFLYVIAALVILLLAAAIAWNLFQDRMMRAVFVPKVAFEAPLPAGAPDYATPAAWVARPGMRGDPALWTPAGVPPATGGPVAIFFVPPTTYLGRDHWNAPLDDGGANMRLGIFVRSQASAFNDVGEIWAPRYRQATIGAFLTDDANAKRALDFAYGDVSRAFEAFLAANPGRPIILAGHSQGSLHLARLLAERVGRDPALRRRVVAAYLVGWPISVSADLPAFGLPGCDGWNQANCVLSWQSFAEPADPGQFRTLFEGGTGYAGAPRRGTRILCVNPVSGTQRGVSTTAANGGSLIPNATYDDATLDKGRVPARCDPATGLLLIGPSPEGYGRFVLGGGNYHVFDYALFWADIRADVARRTAAFLKAAG
jgi:hypothetical protein